MNRISLSVGLIMLTCYEHHASHKEIVRVNHKDEYIRSSIINEERLRNSIRIESFDSHHADWVVFSAKHLYMDYDDLRYLEVSLDNYDTMNVKLAFFTKMIYLNEQVDEEFSRICDDSTYRLDTVVTDSSSDNYKILKVYTDAVIREENDGSNRFQHNAIAFDSGHKSLKIWQVLDGVVHGRRGFDSLINVSMIYVNDPIKEIKILVYDFDTHKDELILKSS